MDEVGREKRGLLVLERGLFKISGLRREEGRPPGGAVAAQVSRRCWGMPTSSRAAPNKGTSGIAIRAATPREGKATPGEKENRRLPLSPGGSRLEHFKGPGQL